jgi:hypothetical protein
MAEKLPVIIDNRGDNKGLHVPQRLLPNLQRIDVGTNEVERRPDTGAAVWAYMSSDEPYAKRLHRQSELVFW